MRGDSYWRVGCPSLGNERIWCAPCGEYTIHRWGTCIHCGKKRQLTKTKRRPPISRASGPRDPVTGRILGAVMKRG